MKLTGWKRQTGAAMTMPLAISLMAQQFLGVDTQDVDRWLTIFAMIGLPLWGVGWIDKVLPFSLKLERVLEIFNAWAAKQQKNERGEVALGTVGKIAAIPVIIAAAFTANEIQDKGLEERVATEIQASIDSVDAVKFAEDSIANHVADSVNRANLRDVRYEAVRPEANGTMKSDKFNPLYYHEPDEFVVVKTYRSRKGSPDTTLISSVLVEANARWLLDVKARAKIENPPKEDAKKIDAIEAEGVQ